MSDLLHKVADRKTLRTAWKLIKHRATSKGFDNVTIEEFKNNLRENLKQISQELLKNQYKFSLLRGQTIEKPNKVRPLRIPAVKDRVVQKAIQLRIQRALNKKYQINNPASYAYIKNRSVVKAVEKVKSLYAQGYRWVYIADIEKFFDKVDPSKLLSKFIFPTLHPDKSIDDLIKSALKTEIGNAEEIQKAHQPLFVSEEVGIAQGGILSPLFANVYLSPFDHKMINNKFELIRYADDFIVMCKTKEEAENAYKLANKEVKKLKLNLYPLGSPKSKITYFNKLTFLGIRFVGEKKGLRSYPSAEAVTKMEQFLADYNRRPYKTNLVDNLNYLKNRVSAWGYTYCFTDFDEQVYKRLENQLVEAISSLMKHYGFYSANVTRVKKNLNKIGIPTFTEKYKEANTQYLLEYFKISNP